MKHVLLFCLFLPATSVGRLEETFSTIYRQKLWGINAQGQGCSGSGSKIETTREYRELLEMILDALQIHSVVDLGCGDWEFSRAISWTNVDYKGFDVVAHVIDQNNRKYAKNTIAFAVLDATQQELPSADLLICKDVLQHLSNADVQKVIQQFKKYTYCLVTNDVNADTLSSENYDIVSGDYRPLDLTKPPFNLKGCKLLTYKSEYVTKQVLLIKS